MGVPPATVQRHSSITVTAGTYVDVIEAVQHGAGLDGHAVRTRGATIRNDNCRQSHRQTAENRALNACVPWWS
jgi:hypothetical protein